MFRVLLLCIVHAVVCHTAKRQYLIVTDFFTGIKAHEYSVYYPTSKILQYRIESKYHILQSLELVSYPTKTIIGKLKSKIKMILYEADFDIYDNRTRQWLKGTVKQGWSLFRHNWTIEFNGRSLLMETESLSFDTNIFDQQNNRALLAKFRLRPHSLMWVSKYDLEIYSNEIPDSVYLLSIAARDRALRPRRKG
ncbi:unnamed protein product [Rotaria socialis]|uniref:Uncharacterized protein n=1 Tax=Rotaria socialis TaxID=392032 RepID=A0A820NDG1_9BILA|nr:unnamed protein product [Rotaria socialis]CAF3391560.1 unnamed protein product [Rotaria socialis]CAF3421089.1 unnamed protein product [Rotaria socialis]CAF3467682.1 unnamed protein product [Rotaria socialis]CAF3471503.1 unnamed protein product [Rotaria socialis]